MWRVVWCVAGAMCVGTGCVSSGTWSTVHAVEDELEREERAAEERRAGEERAGADGEPEGASDCAELAARVTERSPALAAARQRARAALARGRSEGALPAPSLMLEVWDFPIGDPQLADREGMYMVGLSQALPPAGALDGRARAGAEQANAALGELADARGRLHARALEVCVNWSAAELESSRIARTAEVARNMREMLLGQMRAGASAAMADVARLDAELARLERAQVELEGRARSAAARLGAWLDAPPPSAPPSLELPAGEVGVERWIERALERHGRLRAARSRARAAAAMADAADASATIPTFTIGASYMQMPETRAGAGITLEMTLPWLWSGEGAARDAARLEVEAELEEVRALELEVRAEVHAAAVLLHTAAQALETLREQERPAAERTLESIAARYPSGGVDLVAWLDAVQTVRALDIEEARLLAESARAWAGLERAVGEALNAEASDE